MSKQHNIYYLQRCLKQMALGSEEAFNTIYACYRNLVLKNAFYYLHDYYLAEDIAQDVFAKVWQQRRRMGFIENFSSYLLAFTRNSCLNVIKKNKREFNGKNRYSRVTQDYVYDVEERLVERQYRQVILEAVEKLPAKRKQVYLLIEAGCRYEVVAGKLNISRDTVKQQRALANKAIRMDVGRQLQIDFAGHNNKQKQLRA